MKKIAVRNLELCTKDCLCLFVCPVGATDTENSIIDVSKCIGCGSCAESCPSNAISLVPLQYPPQQKKKAPVIQAMNQLAQNKADMEKTALQIMETTEEDGLYRLTKAVAKSLRLLGADTDAIRFRRQCIANESETVADIAAMRADIDRATALRLNPYLQPEEVDGMLRDSEQ